MKRPPIYKVMLHNDNYNRREYVVKVLLKVVQGISVDDAVMAMQVRATSQRVCRPHTGAAACCSWPGRLVAGAQPPCEGGQMW